MCGMNQERTGILDNYWTPPWLEADPKHAVSPVTGLNYPMPCSYQVHIYMNINILAFSFANFEMSRGS